MKRILLLGAGLSASSLIRYILKNAEALNWELCVVDQNVEMVKTKLNNHPRAVALSFDATKSEDRLPEIERADLVISMLPARFHLDVAKDCLKLKRNLITPSYVSHEMHELDEEVRAAGLLFMNEIGVDPGIDHMSAMQIIDDIRENGGEVTSFKSYCGGLMAPESDNNPWNYKFTWNPRNVVLAGQGVAAQYIDRHQFKYIPYTQLYSRLDHIEIEGYGGFDGYANRDSLSYRAIYGLDHIPTIYRGTLRRKGFCQAWNIFVQLGMTDDNYHMEGSEDMTPRDFLNAFLPYNVDVSVEDKMTNFCAQYGLSSISQFEWLGIFESNIQMGVKNATPAELLTKILVDKWVLEPHDKDMLVMVHQIEYTHNGDKHLIESSLVNIGEDPSFTAMSNTVGLPVGICAKLMLTDQISERGVTVPTKKEIYAPILAELADYGISFSEKVISLA